VKKGYTDKPVFAVDVVRAKSCACATFAQWVIAVVDYVESMPATSPIDKDILNQEIQRSLE